MRKRSSAGLLSEGIAAGAEATHGWRAGGGAPSPPPLVQPVLAGGSYSIADLACYAYVDVGHEAGLDMSQWPTIVDWLAAVAAQPGFVNDLQSLPTRPLAPGVSIYR